MKNTISRHLFICLLIFGLYTLTIYSYGDFEFMYDDDNDLNITKKMTFENFIKYIDNRHRIRRALGDPTMVTNDPMIPTIATSLSTVQTSRITNASSTSNITTNLFTNGTYIIIDYYTVTTTGTIQTITSITTTSTTQSTSISVFNFCVNTTHMIWTNGTCVTREFAQTSAILTIYSNSSNDTEKADALAIYVTSISNSNVTSNSSNILTIAQIDQIVGNLTNDNYTVNTNDTIFIMTRPNLKPDGENKIGASFQKNIGGTTIYIDNKDNVTNSNLSAAGIITLESLNEVKSFNMIIIYDSTAFENADNSSNKTLSSSIIFATINGAYLNRTNITITLYFQVLKPPKPTEDVTYLCTFYDTNTLKWNEFGCTVPRYNRTFDRYECQCNHLTSFALIWLPKSLGSSQGIPRAIYNNQDKASIAFQIISIFCFILVVMHGIAIQFIKPQKFIKLKLLLPLISCIVTMILFIFYIALGLTVYSRFSQSNVTNGNFPNQGRSFQENSNEISLLETKLNSRVDSSSDNSSPSHIPCLPNEHALMFIVFFFIIFMFGVKTSFGYYNYRYYVQLNPPPSVRSLVITIGISFLIGIIYMVIAAGLNYNPSNEISEIYVGKLCWFNRRVIHYFLTIPICIFLLISIILIIWVTKRMIAHINRAEESTSEHTRKKYCLIVVLTSCVTQGLGWLFGPLILIADPKAGEVLGWFFVIFNGLEGVWIIILYIIARKEHMGEKMRARDYTDMQLTDMREETPEPERDDQNINRTAALLKSCKSDSPRNSFVDLSAINIYHRAYPDDNDQ